MTRDRNRERRMLRGHDFYMDVWHRRNSLERFLTSQVADWMSQIDIDCCEYCHLGGCQQPVALIETKLIWSASKTVTVTRNLAMRAHLTGGVYLVEYETKKPIETCSHCERPSADPDNDVLYFVVTDALTDTCIDGEMTPQQYAEWLWELRFSHWESECPNPARARMLKWPATKAR